MCANQTVSVTSPEQAITFSDLAQGIHEPVIVDLMAKALSNPNLLSLAAGFTDNTVLPHALVTRIVEQIAQSDRADAPLQYGSNQGRERLRALTCEWMATHPGESVKTFKPAEVFVTNGSQQALYLAAQTLCNRGDIVLVESPSYFVCLEMLKGLGLRPVGIPCRPDGAVIPEAFAECLRELDAGGERDRVKAIYLVSYFSNPSSRSMTREEKRAIAATLEAEGYQIPVIEDAAYRELYFDAPHETPSILSLPEFDAFPKLYLGTYTKPFATGLKVGYGICTHPEWLAKMLGIKGHQDFGTAHFNQALIEHALDSGMYAEHLKLVRPHYAEKAAVMQAALEKAGLRELGWEWEAPKGGLIFWMRAPNGMDLSMDSAFCQACIEHGVLYVPGELCFADGATRNCIRLSTGALDLERMQMAVERLAEVARKFA